MRKLKSYRLIFSVAKTELKNIFYSPIAWLILVAFTIQITMPLIEILEELVKSVAMGRSSSGLTSYLLTGEYAVIGKAMRSIYLYMPLLTMGLMSKEISSGSIKLLFSSPITSRNIILGKFLSMMMYSLVLMVPIFIYVVICSYSVDILDIARVFSGLLGLFLLICAYSAIGIFMSSLTSYQVVAAVGTLAVLAVLNFVGKIGQGIELVRDITYWLSITGRAQTMSAGLISTEGLLYFILVIGMFLGFSIIRFESGRIKNKLIISSRYAIVIAGALILGYISSRPSMKFYLDTTATKSRTLTENSQKIISQLDGDLSITTYVNLLDFKRLYGMPKRINEDKARFQQYTRFKPEIELKYVYYWDKNLASPDFYKYYPNMTDEQVAHKLCDIMDLDFDDFLRPEEIRKKIDLTGERNSFVRVIERGNGAKTWLRIYNDMQVHPTEREISVALRRLVKKAPKVGFLTGHGERDINNVWDRGYHSAICSKTFRSSLLNQGLDYTVVDLSEGIEKDLDILVIADMKQKMTKPHLDKVLKYVENGGNLLILTDPRRRREMSSLINYFGVKLTDGIIVKKNDKFIPNVLPAKATAQGVKATSPMFRSLMKYYCVAMPETVGLTYDDVESKGYSVVPLLVSDKKDCWNEKETTDFVDGDLSLNTSIGEVEKEHAVALALSRKVNNKKQKIIIIGDADCLSNKGLSSNYSGMNPGNFTFFRGIFHWLTDFEVPIETSRPRSKDYKFSMSKASFKIHKLMVVWMLPLCLIALYLFIWRRRKQK